MVTAQKEEKYYHFPLKALQRLQFFLVRTFTFSLEIYSFKIITFLWISQFGINPFILADQKQNTLKVLNVSERILLVSLSLRLLCCMSHPLPHLLFKGRAKASVYYEVPRALCRVVLSNNHQ